ncbi:MAG: NAD-dependent epimerase/dehydratase family protein [Candidatus Binatia bacterium]
MKILVTGGTGFLGRYVVRRLLDAGDFVRVLVRARHKGAARKHGMNPGLAGAEEITGDLQDEDSLQRAVQGMDAICHCAAHVQTDSPWKEFEEITVRGTERLLEAACREGVSRFLHISSLGIYGLDGQGTVTEESSFDDSEKTRGHYTRSKIEAERLVWKYHRDRNLPVTVVRPGILYGPGRSPFVARLCVPIAPSLTIAVGRSHQRLSLSYVEDVAEAVHLALRSNRAVGKAYNIVEEGISQKEYLALLRRVKLIKGRIILLSPTPLYPLLSLLERLCRWLSITPPVSRHQFERALASLSYDTSRAREELGWRPKFGVVEGLMKIRAAMEKAGSKEQGAGSKERRAKSEGQRGLSCRLIV